MADRERVITLFVYGWHTDMIDVLVGACAAACRHTILLCLLNMTIAHLERRVVYEFHTHHARTLYIMSCGQFHLYVPIFCDRPAYVTLNSSILCANSVLLSAERDAANFSACASALRFRIGVGFCVWFGHRQPFRRTYICLVGISRGILSRANESFRHAPQRLARSIYRTLGRMCAYYIQHINTSLAVACMCAQ